MYKAFFKRSIDISAAALGLLVTSPILILLAMLIACSMGRPVLFRQRRLGYREREFSILKFRSMNERRGPDGQLLPDTERLTALGRFLRKSSLDELPQLWNVLKGEMSLVGPRPLYTYYLPYYTPRERVRHSVRPGITGLAQVSGRNTLSWDDRLEIDVQYVEQLSFSVDIMILRNTLMKVVRQSDIVEVPGTVQGPLSVCRQAEVQCK